LTLNLFVKSNKLDASSSTRKELMDKSKEALLTAYSQLQSDEQNMAHICESSEMKAILTTMQKTEDNMKLQRRTSCLWL